MCIPVDIVEENSLIRNSTTKRLWDRRFRMKNIYLKFDLSPKTETRQEIIIMKKYQKGLKTDWSSIVRVLRMKVLLKLKIRRINIKYDTVLLLDIFSF